MGGYKVPLFVSDIRFQTPNMPRLHLVYFIALMLIVSVCVCVSGGRFDRKVSSDAVHF